MDQEGNAATLETKDRGLAVWSIGIYDGATLSDLKPAQYAQNPVLCAQDVSDAKAQFVADPFMIREQDTWHMFFEVMNAATGKGDVGLATSRNGSEWKYKQIVLTEPFHISYPYVFYLNGSHYMIPETYQAEAIRLYRADPFPTRWTFVENILEGPWVDSSIFFFGSRWWLFSSPVEPENEILELFHAESIIGPWLRHPMSPLMKGDKRMARSAGRVIVPGMSPIRFTQNCVPFYGTTVRAFEVSELSTSHYSEKELVQSPILSAGDQLWNRSGMHHIDSHLVDNHWFACVDGWRFEPRTSVQNAKCNQSAATRPK